MDSSDSESYDSDTRAPQVPQQAMGYNSYGRPSMTGTMSTPNSSQRFQQESSEEEDEEDDEEEDVTNEEEKGSDEYNNDGDLVATPIQPRGKTFRPPVGNGDSSSSSEDEGGYMQSTSYNTDINTPGINPSPGGPRGKELRLIARKDDNDDEPMKTRKNPKGATPKGASIKKSPDKASAKKSPSKAATSKKRKAPSSDTDSDSDDSDDDACVATIVAGSDSEDVVTATIVKSSSSKGDGDSAEKKPRGKPGPKKGSKRAKPSSSSLGRDMPEVSSEQATAANESRLALQAAIDSLPYKVSDSHIIRSFGRIKPEYNASPLDALYSSPHAIYPVGFSCDRFEFSPVHGRVIRMRCDILDGSSLREYRDEMAKKNNGPVKVKSENVEEPALVDDDEKILIAEKENVEDLGDGPVFRVTLGAGVDEDKLLEPSSPFDPYLASAHLGGDVDAIAVPLSSKKDKPLGYPEAGMRVSVCFDTCKMYGGTITSVKPMENKEKQRKKAICDISILYDDGVTEIAPFPDPDIIVAYQGCPPIETPDGHVTEMNGKSVRSVLAKSPIEAWGRTLLSLGLIDEVMYEAAMKSLDASRNHGFNEVREKMDAYNKKRRDDRTKEKVVDGDATKKDTDGASACDADNDGDQANAEKIEVAKEDYSTEEVELRKKLAEMQKKLEATKKRSKAASFSLASVRIATISPFAANPFLCREESAAIEKTWFAAAVKKERALMGNTGNKRKIVTPSTMLDKSDAFFTQTIERLIEGLPGSEFAPVYVFHANRSASGGNQAWVHEAKIRQLKQHQKRQSMDSKGSRQSSGNSKRDREREMKRKLFEATLAGNKRLRQEQDDEKKRTRVNKRLAQLNSQMDDRLFKEACMARERNVMNLARGMTKEFARRRKAIELIVCNAIERDAASSSSVDTSSTILTKFGEMLPPVARIYEVEVVRIWDFLHSFSEVFSKSTELSTIPSLDALQDAFVCLKTNVSDKQKRLQAVDLFKGIALDLCKVISPSLTKMFSTSSNVIENIGKNGTEGGPQEDLDVSCLPVTELSWREIARMVFVYDVLTDLGYSKQDAANLVKGYRSGGHPNSREAKRWKKIEESPVVIFYQRLENHDEGFRRRLVRARVSTPCTPSSVPGPEDWQFYLHNIKSKPATSLQHMKDNVSKSLTALRLKSSGSTETESYIKDLEKCLATLERSGNGNNMTPGSLELHKADLHKAKELVIGILDQFTPPLKSHEAVTKSSINTSEEQTRPLIGLHKMYQMSREQFKLLEQEKEKYMVAALKLKEDLERKSADDGANDDEEDDEDDEDGKDNSREEDSDKMDVTESNISASRVNGEHSFEAANTNITEEEKKSGAEDDADAGSHIPTEPPEPAKKPRNKVGRPSKVVAAEEDEAAEAKVEYDFCEDISIAPDLIRRCLAVIRALCATNSAEPFIYPVDPQLYPGYYENVMQPISLYDVGQFLLEAGHKFSSDHDDPALEEVVAEFGRKVRTIVQNSINNNASNNIVNSVEEMSRIFERMFFDWVLAPTKERPEIEYLDDDMCVDHHESDVFSMVLVCDGCEAKYNMSRLKPALDHVPSGDWYCPRCATGRSWLTADPRIGRIVRKKSFSGTVQSCKFFFTEDGRPSIVYRVLDVSSGRIEFWGVEDIDASIVGNPVEPLRCLQALAECPGYGFGRDSGIIGGALPITLMPLVGDKAAQAALSSGIFKDTVSACVSLTNQPEDLNADEWIQMLILLVTKCSQSDELQEISSKIEAKEHTRLASDLMTLWRCRGAKSVAASKLSDDDTDSSDDEEPPQKTGMPWEARSKMIPDDIPPLNDISPVIENTTKKGQLPIMVESAAEIVTNYSGDQASSADDRPANVEISFNSSINISIDGPDETKSAVDIPSYSIDAVFSEEDILRKRRECSFLAKARREKKREDALVGFCIGKGLKSAAASFEEDFLQTIVNGVLCNQEEGLDFSAVRCQEKCYYCGLSDLGLGAPLCRTPNRQEWREIFPLAVHKRTTYMIAEIPDNQNEEDEFLHPDAMTSISEVSSNSVVQRGTTVIAVRVRVGGELVSSKSTSDDNAIKNFDTVMQQFLPHNPIGFQSELKFRGDFNLSILSGSLSAHEVCAVAAHRTLKDKYMNERIQLQRYNMSRIAAFSVGKTIPIGTDPFGRTYWVFNAESNSLFVCQHSAFDQKQWHKYEKPEEIASVLVCLGKHPLCDTLKETFPEAAKALKNRSWSTLLMKRSQPRGPDAVEANTPPDMPSQTKSDEQVDFGEPFVEDEDVLVESENGKFLWDAVIVDSSKDSDTGKVNGYLVHYKNWSSRFDRWVVPDRVVEPNKINMEVQEEVLQDFAIANDMTPPALKSMFAVQYLNAKKRARSTSATKTEIFECALPRQCASHGELLLGHLKSALLLIESALPRGSVGSSGNGSWTAESAALWRNFVKDSQGPESLMRCVLLLEDAINPHWLHSQATQLYACIPKQYRAMSEASLPSIALRVSVLDRCLKYDKRKKKHKTDSP